MLTLYEILNGMVGDDITGVFSPQEIQSISEKIECKLKKKIGMENYQKLEECMIENKDNEYLKSLAVFMGLKTGDIGQAMSHVKISGDKIEIVLGYKILLDLHEKLARAEYDAEEALLNL